MTALAVDAPVVGSTYPRIYTKPLVVGRPGLCGCGCALSYETSYGFDVLDFAHEVLGVELDLWQRWLIIHACELLPDGSPRFLFVLVLVARQNGKTFAIKVLTLFWLYIDRVKAILGTSTNLKYARKAWDRVVEAAKETPSLKVGIKDVREANGQEEFSTVWGSTYELAAVNRKGGRSTTNNRIIMDELREQLTWDFYNAAKNTINAVPDAQVWMLSNMGDSRSVVLNSFRGRAVNDIGRLAMGERPSDPRLGIFEWSSPDDTEPDDIEAIALANPTLGLPRADGSGITVDSILGDARAAKEAGGELLTEFLTEVHCRYVPMLDPPIPPRQWAQCADEGSLDELRDSVAMCLDVSLDEQHCSLYAAAPVAYSLETRAPDTFRIDVVADWQGQMAVSQMADALPNLIARTHPRVLGWFPNGPAAAATAALAQRQNWPPPGITVEPIRGEVSAVCMGFAEQVRSIRLMHSNDPLLNAHIAATAKQINGDGWRFMRKGAGPVDAAYAAAGAVHLARTLVVTGAPRATVLRW